jgi:hypothetical protein
MSIIWPNNLLPFAKGPLIVNPLARGVTLFEAAAGAPTPPGPSPLSITEPAIIGIESGYVAGLSAIDVIGPTGNVDDVQLLIVQSDSTDAHLATVDQPGWTEEFRGKCSTSMSMCVFSKIAVSGAAEYASVTMTGPDDAAIYSIRVSGVDTTNPLDKYETPWFPENAANNTGSKNKFYSVGSSWHAPAQPRGVRKRNTLGLSILALDQHNLPTTPTENPNWTFNAINQWGNSTHGGTTVLSSRLYTADTFNFCPLDDMFDEILTLSTQFITLNLHLNPMGDSVRPLMSSDYPTIMEFNWEEKLTNTTLATTPHPSGLSAGDMVYAILMGDGQSRNQSVYDAEAGQWFRHHMQNGGTQANVTVYSKVVIGDGSEDGIDVNCLNSQAEMNNLVLIGVSGADQLRRIDASGGYGSNGTLRNAPFPAITTTKDNSRVFYAACFDGNGINGFDNQFSTYTTFQHDSVSGLMYKRACGVANGSIVGTMVQETANVVPSGTVELPGAFQDQPATFVFAVPPASGAVSSTPYIAASGEVFFGTGASSCTVNAVNGSFEDGDLLLLVYGNSVLTSFTQNNLLTPDNYGWVISQQVPTPIGNNIVTFHRTCNTEEAGGTFTLTIPAGRGVGVIYVIRNTGGIHVSDGASGGSVSSLDTPSITTKIDNCLLLHVASLGTAETTLTTDGALDEQLNHVSDGAAAGLHLAVGTEELATAGASSARTFTAGAADDMGALVLALKPKVQ